MIEDNTARDLEQELNRDFPNTKTPLQVRAKPTEVARPLADQLTAYERVKRELRDRVRRESLAILAEHDRKWAEVKAEFDRKISEEIAKLQQGRDEAERMLIDEYQQKKNEVEALLLRIEE